MKEKKKFRVVSNVMHLLPSQWTDYEEVKTILRKFGFKINDETNEVIDPGDVEITWDDLIELESSFTVFTDYENMEIEVRLK